MRVAIATSQDVAAVLRAPYRRTLWTYYHVQQLDRVEELHERARALHAGGLSAVAFHEPKRLADEHRKLLADAGLVPTAESARESALALVAAVDQADRNGGWREVKV